MTLAAPAREGRSLAPLVLLLGSLFLLVAAAATDTYAAPAAGLLLAASLVALGGATTVRWPRLMAALIVIILVIPIRRYALPGSLPFELEPYRIFVAFLVLGWLASLLVDPAVSFRSTGLEGPLAVILGAIVASLIANGDRVAAGSAEVTKSLTFSISFLVMLYVIVSTIRRLADVDFLVRVLVVGGTIVAGFAIVEARTQFNVFNHLDRAVPFLRQTEAIDPGGFVRVGTAKLRVFASAEHPIALSAALVLLIPLAIYLVRRHGQRRWIACVLILGAASTSAVSRTGILMLGVVVLVFLWLRPRETRRLWPALLPALVFIHFILPGTLGALKQSFLPAGGLVAEQQSNAGGSGSGRLVDLGPALTVWEAAPLAGQGFGTQLIVRDEITGPETNILDDQWLGTLLAVGAVGFAGWLWLFVRTIRRFAKEAKKDLSDRGWLLASLTASVAAYAVGMLTYDSFAFIQVTFLLFILLGLGCVVMKMPRPTTHLS